MLQAQSGVESQLPAGLTNRKGKFGVATARQLRTNASDRSNSKFCMLQLQPYRLADVEASAEQAVRQSAPLGQILFGEDRVIFWKRSNQPGGSISNTG